MADITIETHVDVTLGGERHRVDATATIPGATQIIDQVITIGTETTVTLWDAAASLATSFSFLCIQLLTQYDDEDALTAAVLDLEFSVDDGGNEQNDTKRLVYNVPFVLGADDAYDSQGGTDLLGASTLALIEKIRARNPGTVSSVSVRFILIP